MGYLDNASITVDAVLTKKGREILKNGGQGSSGLNITSFTLSDTGVDYTLWNPSHPSGSSFYGEAIENLPMLEASVHAEYNLRNRLMTFPQDVTAMPTIVVSGLDSPTANILTITDDSDIPAPLTVSYIQYSPSQNLGMRIIILDSNVCDIAASEGLTANNLSGTYTGASGVFLTEQDIPAAKEYHLAGGVADFSLNFPPLESPNAVNGTQTTVYAIDVESGAYTSFTALNKREEIIRNRNRTPVG